MSFQIKCSIPVHPKHAFTVKVSDGAEFLSDSLLKVFAKWSGEQGTKLKDVAAMMTVRTLKFFNYKVYMYCIRSVK